jgi:hypothetical protein
MNRCVWLLAAAALLPSAGRAEEKPYTVAYYYKVKWGFQQEFERLYLKNHFPIMSAEREQGRIRSLHAFRPTFHGEGRADWTFLVVITYASWAAVGAPVDEEAIARKLFPDQDSYKKEEQRRFEILEAHWDIPLTPVSLPE